MVYMVAQIGYNGDVRFGLVTKERGFIRMQAHERFLKYIQFDSTSDVLSLTCPSSDKQKILGAALVDEMLAMGISDARMDTDGYVYGSIAANCDHQATIGLIAHMDTVDDAPALPMNDKVVEYKGEPIPLGDGSEYLDEARYPALKNYKGKHLIVTDGKTILGADDKAGIAEILTACERMINDDSIKHGKIAIGFTPDEEIGRGADKFDVEAFAADFAYTVDGGELDSIQCENFNGASASLTVNGTNIHPGSAKNKMKSAMLIANEFMNLLPPAETPAHTENYEGFFHLTAMEGVVEKATLKYIIRDHDKQIFEQRKQLFKDCADFLNKKYGAGTCEAAVKDSYFNMLECFKDKQFILDRALAALAENGIVAHLDPIRGGTDGARLSYMGLPCPNLPTGGMNGHSRHECCCVESMETMVDVLIDICRAR